MRAYELEEYQTRSGEEIDFKYKEDAEGDNNRGWIIHQIEAYVKGDYAGYISISYIPKERFEDHYPTILNFMTHIGGTHPLPMGKDSVSPKELSDEELKNTVKKMSRHSRKYNDLWETGESVPDDRGELLDIIIDITENELKAEKLKFKKFKKYYVDKPIVDYIRVFKENENRTNRRTSDDEKIAKSPQDYRRQYIGTALYLEAAEYLKGKGLKLHASGLQQSEAEQAWTKFEKEGRVAYSGSRRWLKI